MFRYRTARCVIKIKQFGFNVLIAIVVQPAQWGVLISETQKPNLLWNKWNPWYMDKLVVDREWGLVARNTGFTKHGIHPPLGRANPWDVATPPDNDHVFAPVDGVYHVYNTSDLEEGKPCDYAYPNLATFVSCMNNMCNMIADDHLKLFCYRRISYLSSKHQLHVLLHELREIASQKAVPHRDL